jgi:hypothetical protein
VDPLRERVTAFKRLSGVLDAVNQSRRWLANGSDCGDDPLREARAALAGGDAYLEAATAAVKAGRAVDLTEIRERASETERIFGAADAANLWQKAVEAENDLALLDEEGAALLPDNDRRPLEELRAQLNRSCLPDVNAIATAVAAAKTKIKDQKAAEQSAVSTDSKANESTAPNGDNVASNTTEAEDGTSQGVDPDSELPVTPTESESASTSAIATPLSESQGQPVPLPVESPSPTPEP